MPSCYNCSRGYESACKWKFQSSFRYSRIQLNKLRPLNIFWCVSAGSAMYCLIKTVLTLVKTHMCYMSHQHLHVTFNNYGIINKDKLLNISLHTPSF